MGNIKKALRVFWSPLHRNASYLMINTLGISGLGFIFWIIVARLFSSDEVGLASAIISSMSLLGLLATLGFGIGIIRFLPQTKGKASSDMINSCFTIAGLFSFFFAIFFLIGLDIWSPALIFIRNSPLFFISFLLFVLIWTLSSLSEAIFISKRAAKYVFIKNVLIFSILKLPLPFLLISLGSFGIFSSWGISVMIAFLISLMLFIPNVISNYKPSISIKRSVISPIFHFSIGNYFAQIFGNIAPMILPLIIINMLSAVEAGYYYVSWMIVGLLFMIPTTISTSFLAESSINEKLFYKNLIKSIKFTLLLLIPTMLVIFFLGNWVLLLIGSEYSNNANMLLKILVLSCIPLTINTFYVTIKRIEKRVKAIIFLYAFISISTLIFCYLLIPVMGLNGVGFGWLISQCFSLLIILGDKIKR